MEITPETAQYITKLEEENAFLREKLKKYTSPERNKVF